MIFYIEQQGGTVTKAAPVGKISKGSGKFAQKLVITIPPDLQQPAPGLLRRPDRPQEHAQLKKGKNALISSVGCKNKKHNVRREAHLRPEPRPAAEAERVGHLDREVQVVGG